MLTRVLYHYTDEENISPYLKCPSCLQPFIDPVIKADGNRSCRCCASMDNADETLTAITELLLLDMLDDLRVNCIMCHQMNIRRKDLEHHTISDCLGRISPCSAADLNCPWKGKHMHLEQHIQICPFEALRAILSPLIVGTRRMEQLDNQVQALFTYHEEAKIRYENLERVCEQLKIQHEYLEKENVSLREEVRQSLRKLSLVEVNSLVDYEQENSNLLTTDQSDDLFSK